MVNNPCYLDFFMSAMSCIFLFGQDLFAIPYNCVTPYNTYLLPQVQLLVTELRFKVTYDLLACLSRIKYIIRSEQSFKSSSLSRLVEEYSS